jgi:hypothetical protein
MKREPTFIGTAVACVAFEGSSGVDAITLKIWTCARRGRVGVECLRFSVKTQFDAIAHPNNKLLTIFMAL